ncbi:site-specific integrase [Botryobacter ruber]|uniref:site-specific integrase n=1 Tax=Botryobacter ruber TaxID=2171629 RepID=UPI000E0B1769|nr:site-specific integrase [Botryobacter ruber]
MIPVLTSVMLDTRRPLKDGSFPVRLRLTYQRQRKYFNTNYNLTEEEFAKTQSEKPRGRYKELQLAFQAIEQKAIKVIGKIPSFSFGEFEKKFLGRSSRDEVFSTYEQQLIKLRSEGQAGTASFYESAYYSLISYTLKEPLIARKGLKLEDVKKRKENLVKKKKPLLFSSVTVDFLKGYEKWMLSRGKTLTSISMYLRTLRTLFNDVIATGDLNKDLYPFGKRKYQVPAGKSVKKALVLSDIEKIFHYETCHKSEAKARDLWVFSYLCNGINVKDIARLKYKQLSKETITFIRAKTERTSRHDLKTIVAMRTPEIDQIIERWGNKPALSDSYVFPILTDGLTPEEELATVRQATKTMNKYIKRIAAAVGIDKNVTTYTARHSFSTVLKRAGAPIEFISESLGHSNLKTTESYLDSFEDNVKRQYTAQLTAFKNADKV